MKYKVGDRVLVKSPLHPANIFYKYGATRKMRELQGRVVTIKRVFEGYPPYGSYYIQEDDNIWQDYMFERAVPKYNLRQIDIFQPVNFVET
jgi:hypothetical protein